MKPEKRRTRKAGARAGYTLIELMVSLVVLSLGLFSIIQMQIVSVRGNGYARERAVAMQIAVGVVERIRTQSLGFYQFEDGSGQKKEFDEVWDIQLQAGAPACNSLQTDSLSALESFAGETIAGGPAPGSAYLINLQGLGPDVPSADTTTMETAGAQFMVHYIAHPVTPRQGLAATNEMVRITVFVSWSNKDHGIRDSSFNAFNQDTYWNRHMVSVTTYVNRTILY